MIFSIGRSTSLFFFHSEVERVYLLIKIKIDKMPLSSDFRVNYQVLFDDPEKNFERKNHPHLSSLDCNDKTMCFLGEKFYFKKHVQRKIF